MVWTRAGLSVSGKLGSWVQALQLTELHACLVLELLRLDFLRVTSLGRKSESKQKRGAHCRTNVDEANVAPVHRIPVEDVVVDLPSDGMYAIEVAKVGDEQAEEKDAPDFAVVGCSQDQGLI